MSRSTPRKNRNQNQHNSPAQKQQHNAHARNASQHQFYLQQQAQLQAQQQHFYQYQQYSDFTPAQYAALYESQQSTLAIDPAVAASAASQFSVASAPAPPAVAAARSIEELSTQVLDRYLGYVSNTLHSAHLCVVYAFDPQISNWEKTSVEGTLFICSRDQTQPQRGHDDGCGPHADPCIFVFNRKGLNNQLIEFRDITDCEDQGDLLSFKVGESGIGLWVHDENCGRRTTAYALIKKLWAASRQSQQPPAPMSTGHSISVDHLFASIGQR